MKQAVSFDISSTDAILIEHIVLRAASLLGGETLELMMDLTAVHANGNPLRLMDLLMASKFDFCHDINGIRRHINRNTGKLENFTPKFSAPRMVLMKAT